MPCRRCLMSKIGDVMGKVSGEKNRLSTFSVAKVKLVFSKINAGEEMYAVKIMGEMILDVGIGFRPTLWQK